jgi:DNA-binding SARP family transcriptional activator
MRRPHGIHRGKKRGISEMHADSGSQDKTFAVGVLGPLWVARDGLRRELPRSRKTRGLLAYLALAPQMRPREDLCALLWEGTADPRSELRWSLAKIRAVVGPLLKVSSEGVALECDERSVDALAFRTLASGPLSEQSIADALAMWRGPPLADVEVRGQQGFQVWLAAERDSLSALRANLLKAAVDRAWARPHEALAAARRLVIQEPWNEWGHARVIQLLQRCGRTAEATAYLTAMRRSLSRELGIPEMQLLKAPPPPAPSVGNAEPRVIEQSTRRVVRVEPLKILPPRDDSAALAAQVTASLGAALLRSRSCDVLDEEPPPRSHTAPGLEANFAVRGAVVCSQNATQLFLRCIHLRLGTIVWSRQVDVGLPFRRALPQWIGAAGETIVAAMRAADPDVADTTHLPTQLMRARSLVGALQPEANGQAVALLQEILAADSAEPGALALTAWSYAQRAVYNWSTDPDKDRGEARYFAAAATRTGIDEPETLTTIAAARTLVGDRNGAEVLLDRALRLDAQSPEAWIRSGWLANYIDKPARALRHFRTAIRLAPLNAGCFNALTGLGVAHFIRGDHTRAIRAMEQALALNPKAIWMYRNLVPAYSAAGNRQKAEDGISALVKDHPHLTVAAVCDAMVFSPVVTARIAEGLHSAGLPRT